MPITNRAIHFDQPASVRAADWKILTDGADSPSIHWDITGELCTVGAHHYLRANIELPIIGTTECVVYAVWTTLSAANHARVLAQWHDPGRVHLPSMFGYLQNHLRGYEATFNLAIHVEQRAPGIRPRVIFDPASTHPLAHDGMHGITAAHARDLLACYGITPDTQADGCPVCMP